MYYIRRNGKDRPGQTFLAENFTLHCLLKTSFTV